MNAQSKIEAAPIGAVLARALPELGAVHKNKKNPAFKSNYADLSAVLAAIAPIAEHGLWFRQVPVQIDGGVGIETFYIHESGAELSAGVTPVPVNKNDAQGLGSAISYGRRYGLMTAFGLSSEDDDGNAAARGQSQGGTVSPSQPQQPAKREPAHSALKTKLRGFVHELNGCGDGDELSAFLATPDAIKTIADTAEKLPHLWDGNDWPEGVERPEEFVPLADLITKRQRECAAVTADYLRA
jgi:hypothetical protein